MDSGQSRQARQTRTSNSPSASGAALVTADSEPTSSTGAGSDDNRSAFSDGRGGTDDSNAVELQRRSHPALEPWFGPEAQPPSTGALVRTRSRATSPAEVVANSPGRTGSADGVSTQAATGVTTLTQSRPRRSSQSRTGDQEARRPDPAADPRWEAALRAVGVRPPITRAEPEGTRDTTV